MRKTFKVLVGVVAALCLTSCGPNPERLIANKKTVEDTMTLTEPEHRRIQETGEWAGYTRYTVQTDVNGNCSAHQLYKWNYKSNVYTFVRFL